jgi:hypothetical protein
MFVWMELKCKRVGVYRDELVCYRPRVPCMTVYGPERYIFKPLVQPQPRWIVPEGFIPGSHVLEAYDDRYGGESLFMWDLNGQEHYRPGQEIIPDVCTAPL